MNMLSQDMWCGKCFNLIFLLYSTFVYRIDIHMNAKTELESNFKQEAQGPGAQLDGNGSK
jgi:hypothetical protein